MVLEEVVKQEGYVVSQTLSQVHRRGYLYIVPSSLEAEFLDVVIIGTILVCRQPTITFFYSQSI